MLNIVLQIILAPILLIAGIVLILIVNSSTTFIDLAGFTVGVLQLGVTGYLSWKVFDLNRRVHELPDLDLELNEVQKSDDDVDYSVRLNIVNNGKGRDKILGITDIGFSEIIGEINSSGDIEEIADTILRAYTQIEDVIISPGESREFSIMFDNLRQNQRIYVTFETEKRGKITKKIKVGKFS